MDSWVIPKELVVLVCSSVDIIFLKYQTSIEQAFDILPTTWDKTATISLKNVCPVSLLSPPIIAPFQGQAYTTNSAGHEDTTRHHEWERLLTVCWHYFLSKLPTCLRNSSQKQWKLQHPIKTQQRQVAGCLQRLSCALKWSPSLQLPRAATEMNNQGLLCSRQLVLYLNIQDICVTPREATILAISEATKSLLNMPVLLDFQIGLFVRWN